MNKKGQAILAEYVIIFFVVIAALVTMTTFVQRSLQARIHDADNYVINSVSNSSVCDANCLQATGGSIQREYEPYYEQLVSGVLKNEQDSTGSTSGNPNVLGAQYIQTVNESTQAFTTSIQLPPGCADGVSPKPAFCNNFQGE